MFPDSTGMFTKEQIENCPYGNYGMMEQDELNDRFVTIWQAAVKMECVGATARKHLYDVDFIIMHGKAFYEKEAAAKVINAYLAKKKEKKDGKTGIN